jgi:hypothetical protein
MTELVYVGSLRLCGARGQILAYCGPLIAEWYYLMRAGQAQDMRRQLPCARAMHRYLDTCRHLP